MSKKFGWHSGTVHAQDGRFRGDVTIQDDLIFGDVSAGVLAVTGGIDMTSTTSAIGINMYGGTFATADIKLSSTGIVNATTAFQLSFQNSTYLYSTSAIKSAEKGIVSLYCESLGSAINTDNADRAAFLIRSRMGADAESITTGRNAHALDVLMDCDYDYAVTTGLRNADIRGARIQAYGHNNVSGVVWGAYINAQLKAGYTFNGQIMEGVSSFGAIGAEIRLETTNDAGTITIGTAGAAVSQAVALAIINRIACTTFTGNMTGIWIETPYETDGTAVSGTTRGIYFETGGMFASGTATDWDIGIDLSDSCVVGIDIGACTTGLSITGASTTAISISGDCVTVIDVTNAISCTTGISFAGTATDGILISGACGDAIHLSGTNTTSALHISGDQATAILVDVNAALAAGISFAVDNGITMTTGIGMTCTGTGTITTAISLTYTADATTGIIMDVADAKTLTVGLRMDGSGTYTDGILLDADNFGDGIHISGACSTLYAINIDKDDHRIVLGDSQDASISWKTTGFTQDALVIGVGDTSHALILMDEADVATATDVFDTALSNPGIVFVPATPAAGVYAFIRTYAIGNDVHLVMKGSGDYAALILQPEDDSDNSTFFQWRCHEGAYPYLWELFTTGVVRSYNEVPLFQMGIKDYETTLAVAKTATNEDPIVSPVIILSNPASTTECVGIQWATNSILNVFDETGARIVLRPSGGTAITIGACVKALQADSVACASGAYGMSVQSTLTGASVGMAAYFQGTVDGTPTGDIYAVGQWMNVTTAPGTHEFRAVDVGIWTADDIDNAGATYIGLTIDMQVQDGGGAAGAVYPMRFNCDQAGDTPTAWFWTANNEAIAMTLSTANTADQYGSIAIVGPFGTKYIRVYDT